MPLVWGLAWVAVKVLINSVQKINNNAPAKRLAFRTSQRMDMPTFPQKHPALSRWDNGVLYFVLFRST